MSHTSEPSLASEPSRTSEPRSASLPIMVTVPEPSPAPEPIIHLVPVPSPAQDPVTVHVPAPEPTPHAATEPTRASSVDLLHTSLLPDPSSRPTHPDLSLDIRTSGSGTLLPSQDAIRSRSGNILGQPLPSAGITAVAHVYAADVGVSLQNETVDAIHYDDATQLLMVVKGGVVFAYDLAMDAPGHHEQLVWTYPLQEGPRVTDMRCSLDQQHLGCLRGGVLVELVELTSGITTVYKAEREDLVGFFFTEAPGADVVLVGRSGLELCEFAARRRGLRCRERVRLPVAWHLWTHETRCCLVATGPAGAQYLQAWQFVTSGVLSLPPFVVGAGPAAAAVAALGAGPAALPMPMLAPAMPSLLAGAMGLGLATVPPVAGTSAGALSQQQVHLLKLYGRVYCAYVNAATSNLELYRFYTDTVSLQHTYELFSSNISLSVVDHVLILHHLDTAITVLIDVAAEAADMPVANPLPLAVLYPPPPPPRQALPPAPLSPPPYQPARTPAAAPAPPSPRTPHQGPRSVRSSGSKELTHWEFIMPSTVIDHGHQAVYRLYLDLRAVADSCGNPVLLASFLQRRRSPLLPELAIAPKHLLLGLLRSCLQEQQPPATLRRVFYQVCRAFADVSLAVAKSGGRASPSAAAAVLSLEELSGQLFQWYQQQAGLGGQLDVLYLQAAVSELLSVAAASGLAAPVSLLAQQLQLLLLQGQGRQADLVVQQEAAHNLQLQHALVSDGAGRAAWVPGGPAERAAALVGALRKAAVERGKGPGAAARVVMALPCATGSSVPPSSLAPDAGVPGADAGKAGSWGDALVHSLLKEGNVMQAARVARRLRVTSVHPSEILRVAAAQRDEVAFASVYRCFREALLPLYPQLDNARAKLMHAS